MKRHATDDVDAPNETLCGRDISIARIEIGDRVRFGRRPSIVVDNANPDCAVCLKAIAARLRNA